MKRIFILTVASFFMITSAIAQGEIDAINMSRNDLTGTARSMGMGGAFGALGGDISGIAINPAGIGVYKSSEVVTTMNFRNNKTETSLNAGKIDKSKFQFAFDNMGFVGTIPMDSEVAPYLNLGFSYNKLKNFERKYNMAGKGLSSSLLDYMVQRAYDSGGTIWAEGAFDNGADWLPVLGYKGNLLQYDSNDKSFYSILEQGERNDNSLYVTEKGYVNSYDFNIGTTISDIVSIGFTVSVTDIDYHTYSNYTENFEKGGNMELVNELKTEGTGYQVKAGVIIKPINELRIGLAYHSPTWYEMTDYYWADLYSSENRSRVETPYGETDYDFRTPDKWVFSLAGVIGQYAIISMDYELTNYKNNMRFRDAYYGSYQEFQNGQIKHNFRNASTIRVGAEIRFTPQFSGRVGYAWVQSPMNNNLTKNEHQAMTSGTIPHYTLQGDANYFTYGLGYKFTPNFYTDIAFVMKSQKDDLYPFSRYYFYDKSSNQDVLAVNSQSGKLKNNMFSGLITFGFKF